MGLGIPPLEIKIVLESDPLKSTMLVGRLGVVSCPPRPCLPTLVLSGSAPHLFSRSEGAFELRGLLPSYGTPVFHYIILYYIISYHIIPHYIICSTYIYIYIHIHINIFVSLYLSLPLSLSIYIHIDSMFVRAPGCCARVLKCMTKILGPPPAPSGDVKTWLE